MKMCRMLEKGCFRLCLCRLAGRPYTDPNATMVTTLPHLKELTFLESWVFTEPITELSLPALWKVEEFSRAQGIDVNSDFTAMWNPQLSALFANITHLNLSTGLSGSELATILKTLPLLKEVFIDICELLDDLFDVLYYRPGNEHLPWLRTLGLYMQTSQSLDLQGSPDDNEVTFLSCSAFMDFLGSRSRHPTLGASPTPLDHLVIRIDRMERVRRIVDDLKEIVEIYTTRYGLQGKIYETRVLSDYEMFYLPGIYPEVKHWDEGLMDYFYTVCDATGLYPHPLFGR